MLGRDLLVFTAATLTTLTLANPAVAGHFSACNTKRCRPDAGDEACGREIHWRAEGAKLLIAWDVAGKFLFLQRDMTKPAAALSGDDAKKVADLEREIESGFNANATSDAFRLALVGEFNKDVAGTKHSAAVIADKIAPICQKYKNKALGAGVIVTANPAQLSQQAKIAGILHFCSPEISIRYMQLVKDDVWLKMQDDVLNFAKFATATKQADGHHAHLVSFYYDLDDVPRSAVMRMSLAPYLEYQFSDRNEQNFRAGASDCEIEDAAADELLKELSGAK